MTGHWWLYGRKWPSPPLPKRKLGPPNAGGSQEIFPGPRYKIKNKKLQMKITDEKRSVENISLS